MAMSVFERTKEIGVLRALGWKRGRVMALILLEAAGLGVSGGILGMLTGWGALRVLAAIPQTENIMPAAVPGRMLVDAIAMAVAVGLIAGVIPAWRGAHLSPVEALRYE
jgi:putative ABC transport system permease protein